jgi:hypothetical protein
MGADGSHGPRPYTQHRISTVFLRVPIRDWPAVKRGIKTEFRAGSGRGAISQLFGVPTPVPAVAYAIRQGRHDARLMMLEKCWQEPLGAISPDSLAREGFEDLAEFRAYWMERERKRFTPLHQVFAFRVRPWQPGDAEAAGEKLLDHLYGHFLRELA